MKKGIPLWALIILGLIVYFLAAEATPFWTELDYLQKQRLDAEGPAARRIQIPPRAEVEYALLYEYVQICDFLVAMQESDPFSPDYGGMHEGESPDLWAVVETDNTQEAIRVWSTYGELSGNLDTYRSNIDAAWVYTMNYPAYDEEGTVSDYYRVHNCGWALVAEAKYRQVYQDDSYLWYADSCASYIQVHRLGYTGYTNFYNQLHPLVEGWAAGALYDYGIEQGDLVAVAHALMVGGDVQAWIEGDSSRLWANEVWAMSGGTALWGVCRSVFADDPGAGQVWLSQYLPYMDTYAGPGEWNNSWNVWYAHAYHASAAVLADPLYTGFAFTLVDTLLDADTDDDGGIMATSTDPPTMDQSWVSCYLDYMGLEYLINELPTWDAAALGFIQPDTILPIAQGETYDVTVLVANSGLQPFGDVNIQVSGAFSSSGSTALDFADVDTLWLGQWVPAVPGYAELVMTIYPGGEIDENDTLKFPVNVLGWGQVVGQVTDLTSGGPLAADLEFYLEGIPEEPLFTVSSNPSTGAYQVEVIEGVYRVVVDPQIPYTDREASDVEVPLGQTAALDFTLSPAPVLLVDDDGGAIYDTCYSIPLVNAGYDAYQWEVSEEGSPQSELLLFQAVVWFTGNELDSALTASEQDALTAFLDEGGCLLLSGQNIAENIASEPFLSNYLGASFEGPHSAQQIVVGTAGDPVTAGVTLWFPGAGGAGNQTSTDMISAVGPGLLAMVYSTGAQPGAVVRVESSYRSLFLSFGLEGVSGAASTTTRQEFLTIAMDWFEVPTGVADQPPVQAPQDHGFISLSPNPFNQTVSIRMVLPQAGNTEIRIYDIQGRLIEALPLGLLPEGVTKICYQFDQKYSSGLYLFTFYNYGFQSTIRGILLK